jgi:hypothetical protein
MPTPEQFAQVMSEAQQDYVPKLRKLPEKGLEKSSSVTYFS